MTFYVFTDSVGNEIGLTADVYILSVVRVMDETEILFKDQQGDWGRILVSDSVSDVLDVIADTKIYN